MALPAAPLAATPSVLLVGPAGTAGAQYTSIQDAVDHAQPGDWVLVAPGVYHEKGAPEAGVLITKPNIHLRGMNRDTVIVDGTKVSTTVTKGTLPAGSPACSSAENLQDLGAANPGGNLGFKGYNGIEVKGFTGTHDTNNLVHFLADGVSIENLSVCNYLRVDGNGNEIWWNGGDGQGSIGMRGFHGDYITATVTYFKQAGGPTGEYGIFTSNAGGPGVIDHSYASNMRDSSYYVGACRDCGTILDHPHAEFSALGLSSTNAGGNFIVENGEWDQNRTGLVSNAQNNDDWPSPEYGQCVPPSTSPAGAGTNSCYLIRGNYIHDNNNPNTAGSGLTAVSAIGTGVELAATQHISVVNNRIENNGSWGVITHDLPDPESGPAACRGGDDIPAVLGVSPEICYFFSRGNSVLNNAFKGNGANGNVTNGDIANQASGAGAVQDPENPASTDPNCFSGNTRNGSASVVEWPPNTVPGTGLQESSCRAFDNTALTGQLVCATGAASLFTGGSVDVPCPEGASYPQRDLSKCTGPNVFVQPNAQAADGVCFGAIGYTLSASTSPPMPNPCAGVPANAYCPVAAAPSPTPSILPLTSIGGSRVPLAPVGVLAALAVIPLGLRLRRRRSS